MGVFDRTARRVRTPASRRGRSCGRGVATNRTRWRRSGAERALRGRLSADPRPSSALVLMHRLALVGANGSGPPGAHRKGVSVTVEAIRSVLNAVDTNKDGKISRGEFMTACQKGEPKNVQL